MPDARTLFDIPRDPTTPDQALSNHPSGKYASRKTAKDRARVCAMRTGIPCAVKKYSFRDMVPAYEVKLADRAERPIFVARPVKAHTSPKWYNWERRTQRVRAGLYWEAMEKVCEEAEPPKECKLRVKYRRRIWDRDPQALVALRKFRALGERPRGVAGYVDDVLKNDIVSALEGRGGQCLTPKDDGSVAVSMGGTPLAYHVLNFLRRNWDRKLRWGDEATVRRHSRKGGDLTHYSYPGLSSPASEILRQYRIMRRFQDGEQTARRQLREDFGFDFIEPRSYW